MARAMEDAGAGDLDGAERELASRRRELEAEFADKMRDLKHQHQRRMDRLKEEQAEWEAYRRSKAKEIADKTETVRRRVENVEHRTNVDAAAKKELADLRAAVQRLEAEQARTTRDRAALAGDLERAQARAKSLRTRSRAAGIVLAVGVTGWLVGGWQTTAGLSVLVASVAAAFLIAAV